MRFGRGRKSGSGFLNLPHQGSRLPGEGEMGFNTMFPGRTMSTLSVGSGPMTTSMGGDYGPVLAARRQAKLAAADPGLSTRGRVNAPGRATRPVTGGLETRGVRPTAGSRSVGRPVKTRAPRTPVRAPAAAVSGGPTGYAGLYTAPMGGAGSMSPVNIPTVSAGTGSARAARPTPTRTPGRKFNRMEREAQARAAYDRAAGQRPVPVTMGPTRRSPFAGKQATVARSAQAAKANAVEEAVSISGIKRNGRIQPLGKKMDDVVKETTQKAGRLDNLLNIAKRNKGKTALAVGAGVIGMGALLGGREKRGTSSGSQGMYRY